MNNRLLFLIIKLVIYEVKNLVGFSVPISNIISKNAESSTLVQPSGHNKEIENSEGVWVCLSGRRFP